MSTPTRNTTTRIAFGDRSIKGGLRTRPERFTAKRNWKYRVRILTDPVAYFAARVENVVDKSKSFLGLSLAPFEISQAASEGDAAALAEAKRVCPLWARGYKVERRFVSLLWIISKIDDRGRETAEDKIVPFAFAGEKYQAITSMLDVLPINPNTQQRVPIQAVEIFLTCTDETYQKLTFTPLTDAKQFRTSWADTKAKLADHLADPSDLSSPCALIEEFVEPDDFRNLVSSLDRAENRSGGMSTDPIDSAAGSGNDVDIDRLISGTPPAAPTPAAPRSAPRTPVTPTATRPAPTPAPAPAAAPPAADDDPLANLDALLGA